MPQVVTNENIAQLIETGSVPEFVPPTKAESAAPAESKPTPPRGEDGKFVQLPDPSGVFSDPGAKPVDKSGDKGNITDAPQGEDDIDDNGLTAKERQELTEKTARKIGAKHRQMREAEELAEVVLKQRDEATKRAEQAEEQLRATQAKSRPAAEEAKEPDPKDFPTVQEYRDALKTFVRDQERANIVKERENSERAEQARQYNERLERAKKTYPDFDKVVRVLENEKISTEVISFLEETDFGPELLYDLAKHPKELDRLRKLSPRKAIAELGKLESKLGQPDPTQAAPKETPVSVSQAPAPIAPLEGKSTVVQKDPAKMNFAELREHRRQEQAAARRR